MKARDRTIDWQEVRTALARHQSSLHPPLAVPAGPSHELLRQRAALLANRRPVGEGCSPAGQDLPIQSFSIGPQTYGLRVDALVRILPFEKCTPVPGAAPGILGLVNLGGDIHPAFELSHFLGIQPAQQDHPGYLLVLKGSSAPVPLRVDQVGASFPVSSGELIPAPADSGPHPELIRALTRAHLLILDEQNLCQAIAQDLNLLPHPRSA